MAYRFVEFDGVALPHLNYDQEHGPMPSDGSLLDSVGGVYDWQGSNRQKGRRQTITAQGVYYGQTEYLVTETGERFVTETGEPLIAGDALQMLQAQVTPVLSKKGVRGQLWRKRLADDALHWKTARLLNVGWTRRSQDVLLIADIRCTFETAMEYWHAATATTTSGTALDGTPALLIVDNAGEEVRDAMLRVIRTSGTITAVTVTATGVDWSWTGSIGDGQVLEVDDATQTVRRSASDSYSGFALGSGHTSDVWTPLATGANLYTVTVTGGNANVAIRYYTQFA